RHCIVPGECIVLTADHLLRQDVHLNVAVIQVAFDLVPIGWLAQVGQQMTQPVVTEIQRLYDLSGEAAQGVLYALDIHLYRDLPVIAFGENMRQPNDRRPPPTQPSLLPMARDMPVQDLRQAHRDHLTDQECHIIDALRDDHQVTLPKKLLRLWTQLHSHGVLSSLRVERIPEDNNLTQDCIALPLWTAENPMQIQGWDFFYGEWGDLRDLVQHLPKSCYSRRASHKPDGCRRDYWV